MPSPLAHAALGYTIYRAFREKLFKADARRVGPLSCLLLAALFFSLLPDADSVFGVIFGDFGRFHNNLSHSIVLGLAASLVGAVLMRSVSQDRYATWVLFIMACYGSHVMLDYLTFGRGVMALWPFTLVRFQFPVIVFYGLHWSEGVISIHHIWTILNELVFVGILGLTVRAVRKAPADLAED